MYNVLPNVDLCQTVCILQTQGAPKDFELSLIMIMGCLVM